MCTAATYKTKDFYFGRTLDHSCSYGEEVVITPRNYFLPFRHRKALESHYGIIGMAHVAKGYPLYYDAVNEKGLGMAGLNFVGNAAYREAEPDRDNVAQFEFIPWVLGKCGSVKEVRALLENLNLTGTVFDHCLPAAQLHWLIADRLESITVESVKEGLRGYDNPVGILTNNPPFPEQLFRLNDYMHLSPKEPENRFAFQLPLSVYSLGMGAMGLPGDLSSGSRFVRAAFTKMNSVSGESESESVSQFFHILGSVQQTRGCCQTGNREYEITVYTSCCNADRGIYYYTTYENHQITAVDMGREDLDGRELVCYPLILKEQIRLQNEQEQRIKRH